jgi:hypothetical protein
MRVSVAINVPRDTAGPARECRPRDLAASSSCRKEAIEMPRLVTGVFYARNEAEQAVQQLRNKGIGSTEIYLESEIMPDGDIGRKGGQVSMVERERRFAGLETGILVGCTAGLLTGLGMGILGNSMDAMFRSLSGPDVRMAPILAQPILTAIAGVLLGAIAGGVIGWIVDYTLTRLGAGPPLPREETLVTVRADEARLQEVYGTLFNARARHLHVAEQMPD